MDRHRGPKTLPTSRTTMTIYWEESASADYFTSKTVRLRSHRHECESEYPYTGSKKHEFACISTEAVHIDTSSVQVRVTCEFNSYEQFLRRSFFIQPVWSEQHKMCINSIYADHDNDILFIAGLVAYWLASAYSQDGTARPILSSRDFRQASSVLQLKAFYF